MFFLNSFSRLIVMALILAVPYVLSGGHLFMFFQPIQMLWVGGIYLACYLFIVGHVNPASRTIGRNQIRSAAKAGLVISLIVCPFASGIHILGYLDQDTGKLVGMIVAALMAPLYSILIYFVVLSPYFFISSESGSHAGHSKLSNEWSRSLKTLTVNSLATIGGLFILFCAVNIVKDVMMSDKVAEQNKEWSERSRRVASEEETYIAKNCKSMPSDLKERLWQEASDKTVEK